MSEAVISPKDLGLVDPSDLIATRLLAFNGRLFEFGRITSPDGDYSYLSYQLDMGQYYPQTLDHPDHSDASHYDDYQEMRKGVKRSLAGSERNFRLVFGFNQVATEGNDVADLTILPTANTLNAALLNVYGEGQTPPIKFREKSGQNGKWNGQEFVEALAVGEVLISSPEDLRHYADDLTEHVLGYARIDPKTYDVIKVRAQQLRDQGKLSLDTSGRLKDAEARDFVAMLHDLSGMLNYSGPKIGKYDLNELKRNLKVLCDAIRPTIYKGTKIKLLSKALHDYQDWFAGRISELSLS